MEDESAARVTYETLLRLEEELQTKSNMVQDLNRRLNESETSLRTTTQKLDIAEQTVKQLTTDLQKKDQLVECLSKELVCKKQQYDALVEENRVTKSESTRLSQLQRDLARDIQHKAQVAAQLTHQVESPSAQFMDRCFNLGFSPPVEVLRSLHCDSAVRCGDHALNFKELSALCEVLSLSNVINTKHWVEFHTLEMRFEGDECYPLLEELIRTMPTLQTLIVHNITDIGMRHIVNAIRAVSWVHNLSFPTPVLTDVGVSMFFTVIAHRTALGSSSTVPSSPNGSGAVVPSLLAVDALDLSKCKIQKDATLRMMKISDLGTLSLSGLSDVVSEPVAQIILQQCPFLRVLNVSNCNKLGNGFINDVNTYGPRITDLNISGCSDITTISLKNVLTLSSTLHRVSSLEAESLYSLPIPIDSMSLMTLKCPKLEDITFNGLSLTTREWSILKETSSSLRSLRLLSCKTSGIGELLKQCRKLEYLSLSMSKGLVDSDIGGWCPKLSQVDLTNSYFITDNAIKLLVDSCKRITHLSLQRCSNVTDVGIRQLSFSGCVLAQLNVMECPKITILGIDFLVSSIATLSCVIHETYRHKKVSATPVSKVALLGMLGDATEGPFSAASLDAASVLTPAKRPAMSPTSGVPSSRASIATTPGMGM